MVNNEAFSARLSEVISFYGLTASSFAERIGVQRSSISHLLSGRNKPSLDFVLKVLNEFPEVSLYWLMNGTGTFPNSEKEKLEQPKQVSPVKKEVTPTPIQEVNTSNLRPPEPKIDVVSDSKEIERIVVFYKDGTFKSYTP